MCKRIFAWILCVSLLFSMASPVYAVEDTTTKPRNCVIADREAFLAFAENCRMDSFSRNLEVSLETDIDLTGTGFSGIPIFCGTFLGNGHTIKGLSLTAPGSNQGLFRYLTETATVQDLKIIGTVQPAGSAGNVGSLAGSNAGIIRNCSFTGQVSGNTYVGGIAGINGISGILEDCTVTGRIYGSHFVGGMAGESRGVIRGCENKANLNDSAKQNTVDLSDITIESIAGSESVSTVTDIGGIAGSSGGVIRNCVNRGNVGYQQMGYNIGGIAGTQSGSLLDCENHGQVHGRKDVGGIVGQLEPTALISFEEDALQILQKQLDSMGSTVSATVSNVQGAGDQMITQVGNLKDHVDNAKDAVDALIPDRDNPELPDMDAIQAAQNTVSGSISGMTETLKGMKESTYSSIGILSNNLHSLQSQMNAMRSTLGNISQTLGGSITDVSDRDSESDLTGKVAGCVNYGTVLADRNAGGIAGAVGLENDLDMEEDWSILGENSLNFESELRAVLLACTNEGAITCKKQNAGGIAGWQSLGLVKDCLNVGTMEASAADYVGGISGQSFGYIRASSSKCRISAGKFAGGIAGLATVVTDCRSMTEISGAGEYRGAVLGKVREGYARLEQPVSGNCYFSAGEDPGAIDGISYAGQAEGVSRESFLDLDNLPGTFREVSVTFCYPNGMELRFAVPLGEGFPMDKLPVPPEKSGYEASWKDLREGDLQTVLFDARYEAQYTAKKTVLQAGEKGKAPDVLVQGLFEEAAVLRLEPWEDPVPLEDGETLLNAWTMTVSAGESITGVRVRVPEGCSGEEVKLLLRSQEGIWQQAAVRVDGSYLAAPAGEGTGAIALVRMPSYKELVLVAGAGALFVLLAGWLFGRKEKRTKDTQ